MLRSYQDAFGNEELNNLTLTDFPPELILKISSHLLPEQIILLAATTRVLNHYIKHSEGSNIFWKNEIQTHFPKHSSENSYRQFKIKYREKYKNTNPLMRPIFSIVKKGDIESLEKRKITFQPKGVISQAICATDSEHNNLLHWALTKGNKRILDYFYQSAKAKFRRKNDFYTENDAIDTSREIAETDIMWWALHCDQPLEEIVALITNKSNPEKEYESGEYAIHISSRLGRLEIVDYLISNYPSLLNKIDEKGCTPLVIACKNKHTQIAKFLLATPSIDVIPFDRDAQHDHWTALHHAAEQGLNEIVKIILDKKPEIVDCLTIDEKYHAIHLAVKNGQLDVVKTFLKHDASLVNNTAEEGWTPLLLACFYHHAGIVEFLLDQPGIDMNVFTTDEVFGWHATALNLAASEGCNEIVKMLLAKKPEIAEYLTIENGFHAIHLAVESGQLEVVKIFLEHDASLINSENNNGDSLLMLACNNNHTKVAKFLLTQPDMILEPAVNVLNWAAEERRNTMVNLILTKLVSDKSFSNSFKLPTNKIISKLRIDVQGKLELLKFLFRKQNPKFFENPISGNRQTAVLMKELVFFKGKRKEYKTLLDAFKKRQIINTPLEKIYKKLKPLIKKRGSKKQKGHVIKKTHRK